MINKTFIVAEVGVNHNGSLEDALRYIDVVKQIGADAVKFQTYKSVNVVTKNAMMADYQEKNLGKKMSQLEMIKNYELTFNDFRILADYSKKRGIQFISTAFDMGSVEFLKSIGLEVWKIPSGEITNYPYLLRISEFAKKIIISRGMASKEEITEALKIINSTGPEKEIIILHCVSEYPTPVDHINLRAINSLREEFNLEVGLSDHSLEILTSVAAVAMGARVIEKHITFDKSLPGPDHKASLNVQEFEVMIQQIRMIESALGNGSFQITEIESKTKNLVRKSIVAKKDIKFGEVFSAINLDVKRPGTGISPMRWNELIGRTASKDYKSDDFIDEEL